MVHTMVQYLKRKMFQRLLVLTCIRDRVNLKNDKNLASHAIAHTALTLQCIILLVLV